MFWIQRIVIVALSLYLILVSLIFVQQRSFLYFPPAIYLTPESVNLDGFEEVSLISPAGGKVTAWWCAPQAGQETIMFFHGNGSAVFSNQNIYGELSSKGYGVLGVGYPGYPGSEDEARQTLIVDAAMAQYDFLIENGIRPDDIVFYGSSLGAGVAAQLAHSRQPGILIAEAPFNSVLDMARARMPFLPVKLLLKDQYRSGEALEGLEMPLIWLHGTQDRVIPVGQGQKLFDAYDGPKSAHIIPGGDHNNLWGLGGRDIIIAALTANDTERAEENIAVDENNSKLTPLPN